MSMKPETQLLKAARDARYEIFSWLSCLSQKEIRDSFEGFANAEARLTRAITRYERENKK